MSAFACHLGTRQSVIGAPVGFVLFLKAVKLLNRMMLMIVPLRKETAGPVSQVLRMK